MRRGGGGGAFASHGVDRKYKKCGGAIRQSFWGDNDLNGERGTATEVCDGNGACFLPEVDFLAVLCPCQNSDDLLELSIMNIHPFVR